MNDAYLATTMRTRDSILGRKIFDAFPSDPATESFRQLDESLNRVLAISQVDEIALIRYDIERPDGSFATRYWSATHTPVFDDAGEMRFILQHTVDVTELHKLRQLRDEANLIRRAETIQSRNESLLEESRRLHQFFEQAPGFVAVFGGPEHIFRMANAAYLELVGRKEIVGLTVAQALPEVVPQGYIDLLDEVYRTGEPYLGRRERVTLHSEVSGSTSERVLNFVFQPILGDDEDTSGIIVQGYDVTDEAAFEERQAMLINELQHRVKNTIAVVQVLAKQSFRDLADGESAMAIYSSRLMALSAAHGVLTQGSWGPAPIREIVEATIGAACGDLAERVEVRGPDYMLDPESALGLTMIVHELTTNALKYGALSNDSGGVELRWTIADCDTEDHVHVIWREHGGPKVEPPRNKGFGTRLIERGLGSRGSTGVRFDFAEEGLVCAFEIGLAKGESSAQFGRPFAKF